LFSARIQNLFGSEFGLTSKGFGLVFISESIKPTMIDPLGLISQNYLNTCKPKFQHLWWIILLNFLVLTCERDSYIL